jgi:hypothetical protein
VRRNDLAAGLWERELAAVLIDIARSPGGRASATPATRLIPAAAVDELVPQRAAAADKDAEATQ